MRTVLSLWDGWWWVEITAAVYPGLTWPVQHEVNWKSPSVSWYLAQICCQTRASVLLVEFT